METELLAIKQKMKFSVNKCEGMTVKVKKIQNGNPVQVATISTELAYHLNHTNSLIREFMECAQGKLCTCMPGQQARSMAGIA